MVIKKYKNKQQFILSFSVATIRLVIGVSSMSGSPNVKSFLLSFSLLDEIVRRDMACGNGRKRAFLTFVRW